MARSPCVVAIAVAVASCLLALALDAQAQLLGTGVWSGTANLSTEGSVGIDFRVARVGTDDWDVLFGSLTYDASSVGQVFESNLNTDFDFFDATVRMINGMSDLVCIEITGANDVASFCQFEQTAFGLIPTDFRGNDIRRITLEVVNLEFSSDELSFELVVRVYADGPLAEPCTVTLIAPFPGALMDNGCINVDGIVWNFYWAPCSAATEYNLVVEAPSFVGSVFEVFVPRTSHLYISASWFWNEDRFGLTWKVRARVEGEWGEFTERTFDLEPVGTDCPIATEAITWGAVKGRF